MQLQKYAEENHDAVLSQGALSWHQIFNGKISRPWLDTKEMQKQQKDKSKQITFGKHQL